MQVDEVIKKKQYIQLCTTLEHPSLKYSDLAQVLNVPYDEVEVWAIEAIASGIIDAKIDQLNEEIVIKGHALNKDWSSILQKICEWKSKFQKISSILSHTQTLTAQVGIKN